MIFGFLLMAASIVYVVLGWPGAYLAGVVGLSGLGLVGVRFEETRRYIDTILGRALDEAPRQVFTRSFPRYRFADLQRAVVAHAKEHAGVLIASQHAYPLADILPGMFHNDAARKQVEPEQLSIATAHDRDEFFPADGFWIVRRQVVLRARIEPYTNRVILEVAARSEAEATPILDAIIEYAKRHSIYRDHVVELVFQPEIKDDNGDLALGHVPEVKFLAPVEVAREDLVLPDDTRDVIERNVLGFHEHRAALMAAGVPGKKGILFYGPPGTGKTFTSKYLASRLAVTTVLATGHSLLQVRSVCNFARMLQPALIVLEDVDLVYKQRDINPFSTALGELMDEMDGFGADDEITFILTTNDLDRLESAIKDRPGRISQCVEFELPSAELRARYLRTLLAGYAHERVDLDVVVKRSAGSSQAFLKELVFRAIQFSIERTGHAPARRAEVVLETIDFRRAHDEMTGGAGRAIVGFGNAS